MTWSFLFDTRIDVTIRDVQGKEIKGQDYWEYMESYQRNKIGQNKELVKTKKVAWGNRRESTSSEEADEVL